jgi:hypothetical protein
MFRRACLLSALLLATLPAPARVTRAASQTAVSSFAQTIASLSERGGYFDTDNLISNESSYLQIVPELERRGVRGGAYIGVGPDQNFTYIAATRPAIAFIVDIRRDNVLLHLLFKAMFQLSGTRIEYLARLFGRQAPANTEGWRSADIGRMVRYVDEAPRVDAEAERARVEKTVRGFGVPLTAEELKTIASFHRRFVEAGLSLQFQSAGRPPQSNYPTYRELLLDTDSSGQQTNFLASEDGFQFVRGLQSRDLIIPVVGDLAGQSAMAGIGRLLSSRSERVSAFYVSNVEFYLFREGTFPQFVANLRQLPHTPRSVLIRSIFRFGYNPVRPHDDSVSRVQGLEDLLGAYAGGRVRMYADLVRQFGP